MMDFKAKTERYRSRIEEAIDRHLPPLDARPRRLHEAMRYSIQAGGKRLRPMLCLTAADMFGAASDPLPAAVALECVHTYSLIHDDLPCMDDGQLRRGHPTCHRKFDEWTAVLAGDALLTYAFELLSTGYAGNSVLANDLTRELAGAAGSRRLLGGQVEDILGEHSSYTSEQLDFIHLNKTAALLASSLALGARVADADPEQMEACRQIGQKAGIAFQIIDDILDATGNDASLGKTAGGDAKSEKTTYVKIHGIDESRRI
ncbi:MAG: polyprenyl synthetase family protein, partial [Opitutales bacterium]